MPLHCVADCSGAIKVFCLVENTIEEGETRGLDTVEKLFLVVSNLLRRFLQFIYELPH